MYQNVLKIPHENEIIWTKRGFEQPLYPSGSATELETDAKKSEAKAK